MALLAIFFCHAVLAAAVAVGGSSSSSTTTFNTTSGVFAPYFAASHPDVAAFPDIPYAQNPTGPLRFAPPVRARGDGDAVQLATSLPPGCFQYVPPFASGAVGDTAPGGFELRQGNYSTTSEDCLRVSIFAPRRAVQTTEQSGEHEKPLLPVVVWVHGGGFSFGGTDSPYQIAAAWVQHSQSHVVVQVQYRLNLLGLPNAAGLGQSGNVNMALLDQRMAVEWVRDNIGSLGGDPARITLWGESAGAYGVDGYLFAWADDPIVAGVIADSGNALAIAGVLANATDHSAFSRAAAALGCGNASSGALPPAEELECMRRVPAHRIRAYVQAKAGAGGPADSGAVFGTVVDNVTIFADYEARITARSPGDGSAVFASGVPLLVGTNTNEGAAVVPYDFAGSAGATSLPPDLQGIADHFRLNLQCTTLREARLRAAAGVAPTYQYLYGGSFSDISPRPWLGAYHASELPLVFGTYGTYGPASDMERAVSENMQDLYLAFARDPHRGLEREAGWAPVAAERRGRTDVMQWAVGGKVAQLASADAMLDECAANNMSA